MLVFLKNPLFLAAAAAIVAWWWLRRKADCHCDGAATTIGGPPVIGIWQGYNADPYSGGRIGPGCPQGLVRDVNTGNCVTPIG